MSGATYQGEITDDPAIAAALARGGSTVRLRPRRSATVNVSHAQAPAWPDRQRPLLAFAESVNAMQKSAELSLHRIDHFSA